MSFPQGISFRSTAVFVTDGANDDPELQTSGFVDAITAASYPRTTAQGNTVGWETLTGNLISRNRSAGVDVRLAGFHSTNGAANQGTYRIDLPSAGTKRVRLAAGETNYGTVTNVELFDSGSSLGVLSSTATTAANRWRDATDTERTSSADWAANNASVDKVFTTTICRVVIGTAGATGLIAYFSIDNVLAPTATVCYLRA